MKTLKGEITISRPQRSDGREEITIRLTDGTSHCRAVEISMTPRDFAMALTGLASQPCEYEWNDSGRVGMVREHNIPDQVRDLAQYDVPVPDVCERNSPLYAEALKPFEVDGWRGSTSDLTNHHRQFRRDGKWFASVNFERFVPAAEAKEANNESGN